MTFFHMYALEDMKNASCSPLEINLVLSSYDKYYNKCDRQHAKRCIYLIIHQYLKTVQLSS